MIRIGDDAFFAARKRALAGGLAALLADASLLPTTDPATGDVVATDPGAPTYQRLL